MGRRTDFIEFPFATETSNPDWYSQDVRVDTKDSKGIRAFGSFGTTVIDVEGSYDGETYFTIMTINSVGYTAISEEMKFIRTKTTAYAGGDNTVLILTGISR